MGWAWVESHHGPGRRLHARCVLPASDFLAHRLRLDPDDSPKGHVNVVEWPVTREVRLFITEELCATVEERLALDPDALVLHPPRPDF